MNTFIEQRRAGLPARPARIFLVVLALVVGGAAGSAQIHAAAAIPASAGPVSSPDTQNQTSPAKTENADTEAAPKISADELDSLVGPIALYPDPLLIQVLAASTYPLEVVQLKQWMDNNRKLQGKVLMDAVGEQKWDSSVQALVAFRAVVDRLANHIQWTTDLGNAFLAQESDVMDAVQALRAKAQANGALKTNDKQTVATEAGRDGSQAISIEPAQRGAVYVPAYSTQVVYRDSNSSGYSGYSADSDYADNSGSGSDSGYSYIGYTVAAAYGAYWGYYNWRDRYAEVNYNNCYNYRYKNNSDNHWNNQTNNSGNSRNWSDKVSRRAGDQMGRWQHDPSHRGNAPYGNRDLAGRFGQGNKRFGQGAGNRPSQIERANAGNQLGRGNLSAGPRGANSSLRPPNGPAANRVGDRMPSNWPRAERGGAFGPENGTAARAFSARGAQSMRPPGELRGGPPGGMRAGGPPMGGFRGGPPMGGGGPPMGGAPPPPPHP